MVLINLLIFILFCYLCARYAERKGLSFYKYLFISFLLSPLLTFIYLLLKNDKKLSNRIELPILNKDLLDEINVGDNLNFWANPNVNNEVRVYVRGYVLGDGMISIFKNRALYKFINSSIKKPVVTILDISSKSILVKVSGINE